jgi:hypothetical protein
LDGIRKIDDDKNNYARVCEKSNIVALKTLANSKDSFNFLKEFNNRYI